MVRRKRKSFYQGGTKKKKNRLGSSSKVSVTNTSPEGSQEESICDVGISNIKLCGLSELERRLEEKAKEKNLSAINVKSILKAVITDKDVINMVNCSAEGTDFQGYQQKLTRSKTRELLGPLTHPLEVPVTDSMKSESACLLEKELPEEEDDDEYTPFERDNDIAANDVSQTPYPVSLTVVPENDSARECTTPNDNIWQRTRSKLSLSKTSLQTIEKEFIPPDITEDMYDADCDKDWANFLYGIQDTDFERVEHNETVEEDDPEYNIMSDELFKTVDHEEMRADKAVKITKKELHNLMAEWFGSASYSSCDEASDDDNAVKPQTCRVSTTPYNIEPLHVAIPGGSQSGVSETGRNIPLFSPSLFLTPKESPMKQTFNENHDATNNSLKHNVNPVRTRLPKKCVEQLFDFQQLHLLQQQLHQFVQLVLQNFLLTYKHPIIDESFSSESKSVLVSLKHLNVKEDSMFNIMNVLPAVDLIRNWELFMSNEINSQRVRKFIYNELKKAESVNYVSGRCLAYKAQIPNELLSLCAKSTAFLFPLLLPQSFPLSYTRKNFFSVYESHLIAIGIEEFSKHIKETSESKCKMYKVSQYISTYLMPGRKASEINKYITVKRKPSSQDNHIKFYFENGYAPPIKHFVIGLNKNSLRRLCEQPSELIPPMWKKVLIRNKFR